ncbi:hypothetical protein LCGC14_2642840, partial [marine sediment metagenome]
GLSNGIPLVFRVAFKPTSSISIPQDTANFVSKEETKLIIKGRHDPCIVPRAVPVVENAVASVILDLMLQGHFIKEKIIYQAPAGRKADPFFLKIAKAFKSKFLTNDLCKEYYEEYGKEWIIENRKTFMFIDGKLILE